LAALRLYKGIMLIVHVHARVKPEFVAAFRQATIENAGRSVQEPGIARFDVIQQADDPTRFVLVEVYRDAEAPARHKETAHYSAWRDAVGPMMAEARTSVKFSNVFPPDEAW
jgi:quinol monooxygenase YgiN